MTSLQHHSFLAENPDIELIRARSRWPRDPYVPSRHLRGVDEPDRAEMREYSQEKRRFMEKQRRTCQAVEFPEGTCDTQPAGSSIRLAIGSGIRKSILSSLLRPKSRGLYQIARNRSLSYLTGDRGENYAIYVVLRIFPIHCLFSYTPLYHIRYRKKWKWHLAFGGVEQRIVATPNASLIIKLFKHIGQQVR